MQVVSKILFRKEMAFHRLDTGFHMLLSPHLAFLGLVSCSLLLSVSEYLVAVPLSFPSSGGLMPAVPPLDPRWLAPPVTPQELQSKREPRTAMAASWPRHCGPGPCG